MAAFRGLLLLFVGLQLAQCKHAGGTLKLNSDITEQYISKFSFTCKLRWSCRDGCGSSVLLPPPNPHP